MSRTAALRSSPRQHRHRIFALMTFAVVWLAILDGTVIGVQTPFATLGNSDNDSLVTVNGNAGVMTSTEPYSLVLLGSGLLVVCFAQAVRRRIKK